MQRTLSRCALALALGAGFVMQACTADIHGNTVNATVPANVTISTSADVNNVKPGDSLPLHVQASGMADTMVVSDAGPTGPGDSGAAPVQTQVNFLFQIFIDSVDGSPLMVTTQTDFSVTVPANTSTGSHKVICRVAKGDGTPTNEMSSFDIKVIAAT